MTAEPLNCAPHNHYSTHKRTALITGVTGQDGSYLAELLLRKGYRVIGHVRTAGQLGNSQHLRQRIQQVCFPLNSPEHWNSAIETFQPHEIYHLAGVSFVPDSWRDPSQTVAANVDVTVRILDAVRQHHPASRLFFACSSEIFGRPAISPQNELTPLSPLSPYGITKAASYWMIQCYRRQYGLFAASGILFNHESPRRPMHFVTRKISHAAAAIALGQQSELRLGNLDTARDWGCASDFVDCMWRMLQADTATDLVIGTGRLTSLREVVQIAFSRVGLNWENYVEVDSGLFRPNEATTIVADCELARRTLCWTHSTSIEALVCAMVDNDIAEINALQKISLAA